MDIAQRRHHLQIRYCQPRRSNYATFTRSGNTLFMHVHYWPGEMVNFCGLQAK
jgi:alpha-L-fucosidase